MKLRWVLCAAAVFFTGAAKAEGVTIGSSSKGCVVKGIVQVKFEPPKTVDAILKKIPPRVGFAEPSPLEDLKRQAAALGANRIVIRDGVSEGVVSYGPRTGRGFEWYSTTLTAEAVKC
jgi:hypothetical protein